MVVSGAERARRCREKKRTLGLSEITKEKDRKRKRLARSKMSLSKLTALRLRQRENLRLFRQKTTTETVRLSLADSNFTSKQAKGKAVNKTLRALPANKDKQVEVVQKIAEDLKLLIIEKKHERQYQSLSSEAKTKVRGFYYRDDISYQAPGKRDSITTKEDGVKVKLQKRYLLFSLRELYQMFIQENQDIKLSLSSFQDMRPSNVLYKSCIPHNVCICIYHDNVISLLKSLSKNIDGYEIIDLHTFIDLIVCDSSKELCMFRRCIFCFDKFKNEIKDKIIDPMKHIKWTLWTITRHGRAEKIEYEGAVAECVNVLEEKIEHFLFHVFVKRQQSSFFEMEKANVGEKKCIIQVDYSENFSLIDQNEIQTAHWSRRQLSLFTTYLWTNSIDQAFVIVSNDITHNKFTVSQCLERVFKRAKSLVPSLNEVVMFSDGSASQFKQRYLFKNLSVLADKFDISLSWNFFASHHGKGRYCFR